MELIAVVVRKRREGLDHGVHVLLDGLSQVATTSEVRLAISGSGRRDEREDMVCGISSSALLLLCHADEPSVEVRARLGACSVELGVEHAGGRIALRPRLTRSHQCRHVSELLLELLSRAHIIRTVAHLCLCEAVVVDG